MTIMDVAQQPYGISVKTTDCTAQNESGAALAVGDLVLFDSVGLGDVSGAVKGDSIDPADANYYYGIVRHTPDKSTGTAAEDAVNGIVGWGCYGIALEAIADGASGRFRVQGYVQANVMVDEGGISGAGTVGTLLGATEATTLQHEVLHSTADCTGGTKVLAICLEVPTDIIVEENLWVLFDGINGFGVMA